MKQFLTYWFWPNPGEWHYHDSQVASLVLVCVVMMILSFAVRHWRSTLQNPITRQLSSTWSSVLFWLAVVGLVLVVSRVEMIQFLAMRGLWALWALFFVLYAALQVLQFRRRHYTVIGRTQVIDERDKYLPRRKK